MLRAKSKYFQTPLSHYDLGGVCKCTLKKDKKGVKTIIVSAVGVTFQYINLEKM